MAGHGESKDIDLIKKVSEQMMGKTICALSDAAAMPAISFVTKFRDEFETYIKKGSLEQGDTHMPKIKVNGKESKKFRKGRRLSRPSNKRASTSVTTAGIRAFGRGVCRLCMVQVEGVPKLQIACNTEVKDGMSVNNTSDMVKDTVKWGLDFPFDQSPARLSDLRSGGECGLQDQYMQSAPMIPKWLS